MITTAGLLAVTSECEYRGLQVGRGTAFELKITCANRIDHNTVPLNSLEIQLCISVVINSTVLPQLTCKPL